MSHEYLFRAIVFFVIALAALVGTFRVFVTIKRRRAESRALALMTASVFQAEVNRAREKYRRGGESRG